MSSFFNLLPEGSNVKLEKCGDVVVSPKDNIVALFCDFCSDIFTQLPEFGRHLQSSHSDILPFSNEQNVYSVEELLSQQNEVQDDASQSDSSSSGDSGLPAEGDDEDNKEQQQQKEQGINELDACQFNARILEALAANDIDVDVPPDNLGKRDLLAEVEAMLFEDAPLPDNKSEDIQIPSPPKQNQRETKIVTESTYCKVETNHKARGCRQSRGNTEQRSLSICDLKSYSITRMSRKREMKRMSSIKMRIMRSLEIEEMAAKPARIPLANLCAIQAKDNIKMENLLEKEPLKSELKLSPINEIKTIDIAKENQNLFPKVLPDLKKSLIKPTTVSNSNKMKPLISSTSNTKSCESIQKPSIPNNLSRLSSKMSDGKLLQIEKIEILPRLNIKEEKPTFVAKTSTNSSAQLGAGQRRNSVAANLENESDPVPKKYQNDSTFSLKTQRKMDGSQDRNLNESKAEIKRPKVESNESSLNFSLSDSVIEFLQTDLKSTQLNGVDSLLQLAMPNENDAPKQVKMDQQIITNSSPESAVKAFTLKDDINLLRIVGLPIIKISTIEDKINIDVSEGLRRKATKFSNIFHSYKLIWSRRKCSLLTESLSQQLKLFTDELNRKLEINLKVNELKRLLNLINIWHTEQIELVYFKKKKLSPDLEFYFQLFGFLSKMKRFSFYCEHCEHILNLETDYKKHLLKHKSTKTDIVKCYESKKMKNLHT